MKTTFYNLFVVLLLFTPNVKGQSNENSNQMKKQILIDKFFIPKNSIEEFNQQMRYNRDFNKNLPGFIKDEVFVQMAEDGSLAVITVAIWENRESLIKIWDVVQNEYKRIGFNPVEFCQRLNIKMERGLFQDMEG
ncbi:MAG: hypothetical protein WC780_19300 [Lentimicrobiaceae bacterium]|jgi:hypothetical protein